MLKKTKTIVYNLADRDRQFTGVDRSDMDIRSMIERINAPDVQELVANGDLYGFYGHEIRARFGMNPPDVWINPNTGESIRIEPAIRTIKLSADSDGNVSTKHEFLDTDPGRYSERLYSNKVGGFSTAITRVLGANGLYEVTKYAGSDYVRQPNYNTNRGGGVFDSLTWIDDTEGMAFDSLVELSPHQTMVKRALEMAIGYQYDSIEAELRSDLMVSHYQREAMAAQDAYLLREQQLANIAKRRIARTDEVYDNLLCPSESFDAQAAKWDSFAGMGTSDRDLQTIESAKQNKAKQSRANKQRPRIFPHRQRY